MDSTTSDYQGWGKLVGVPQRIRWMRWRGDSLPTVPAGESVLPRGLGRSYGDSCVNFGNTLLPTTALGRFVKLDLERGLLVAEAGVSLDEVLRVIVPHGWFAPVVPGTRFVTLGGCVANDIHGKNHHKEGTFGSHVEWLELLRSDGVRYICSATENEELFRATIGGIGLTGMILRVALRLRRISSAFIDLESVKFSELDAFFEIHAESEPQFDHTVACVDCSAGGGALARRPYIRCNFSPKRSLAVLARPAFRSGDFLSWALFNLTVLPS